MHYFCRAAVQAAERVEGGCGARAMTRGSQLQGLTQSHGCVSQQPAPSNDAASLRSWGWGAGTPTRKHVSAAPAPGLRPAFDSAWPSKGVQGLGLGLAAVSMLVTSTSWVGWAIAAASALPSTIATRLMLVAGQVSTGVMMTRKKLLL